MTLAALPYLGGKSAGPARTTNTGRWVASLLPPRCDLYAESHGGMGGVLLQREPARVEVFNDLDHRIVDWWRVVRDDYKTLAERLRNTPSSRVEYERCLALLDDDDPVEAARAVTVVLTQSILSSLNSGPKQWRSEYVRVRSLARRADRLEALAARMRHVKLECIPAEQLIERLASFEDSVIYVDPPYQTDMGTRYGRCEIDWERLRAAVSRCRGRVAISGYRTDGWDSLGWERHEHTTTSTAGTGHVAVTECLWTNYEAATPQGRLL